MKLLLAANTLEHNGFIPFVRSAAADNPDAAFVVCGDLLNVFPEPGEDLIGSIFYEIYGEILPPEMERLRATHFRNIETSSLIGPLRDLFDPKGATYARGFELASARYAAIFRDISEALGEQQLYVVPGNMDYPQLSSLFADGSSNICHLDGSIVSLGGVRLAGVGGIPHSAQPFGKVVAISPYEMTEQVYERHLAAVWGCDVLISHLSPSESPALEAFVRESPVRMVICRAPFTLDEAGSCRGVSQCEFLEGKTVIKVRPFDYPENFAFVVDFSPDPMTEPTLEIYSWRAVEERLVGPVTISA